MKKKILAVSIGAVLAVGFLTPALMNAQAQISSESRVLNSILALTEDINKKAQTVNNNLDNIDDDLLLKQKFWQVERYEVESPGFLLIANDGCEFADFTACAFNVESIQLDFADIWSLNNGGGCVQFLIVDSIMTDVSSKGICTPTNLLVDLGVGKIGASEFVAVVFDSKNFTLTVEWNGEKPQGMSLCTYPGGPNECEFVPIKGCGLAQSDICIDVDGIVTANTGIGSADDVFLGAPLTDFPTGPTPSGLDWFDQDGDGNLSTSDALHMERPGNPVVCATASSNAVYDAGSDCLVLDVDGDLANGTAVDCDIETGFRCDGFNEPVFTPEPGYKFVKFCDSSNDGEWDSGEDIVLDLNQNGIFD
jgi:hypothetical protein